MEVTINNVGTMEVEVINPDDKDYTRHAYVINIYCGFIGPTVLVYADCLGDAIDTLIDDSRYNHLMEVEESEVTEESMDSWVSFGGNNGMPYNSELIQAWEL